VAVIDVGADANHPDLFGKIDAAVNQGGGPGGADANGHGTHVASLACGGTNNGVGIAGAGFDCHLIIERTDLQDSSIAASIVDAANRGADAINMSFGDDTGRPPVDAIVSAVNYAYGKGAVLVAAASDDAVREQGQPANILQPTGTGPDIAQGKGLSITAATVRGEPSGAGLGSQISMAAAGSFATFGDSTGPPGVLGAFPGNPTELEAGSLFPPVPGCNCRTTLDGDNRYAYLQGTSMAAPQVSAVAALLKRLNPDLGPADIIRVLKQTARRPTGGWTEQLGWGVMDAGAAADATLVIDRRAPVAVVKGPTSTRGTRIALRLSASDLAPAPLVPSGVAAVEVYRSIATKAYTRIARTTKKSVIVRVTRNTRYRFFAVAIDKAGNRQATPRSPQLRVRVR
jgi:subtilisin family serine protease